MATVEKLLNWLSENHYYINNDLLDKVEELKELETENLIEAYRDGRTDQQSAKDSRFYSRMAKDYVNENFKTK
jgi:hypothetical protein